MNSRSRIFHFLYFVILTTLAAMLVGFEGTITLEIPHLLRITMGSTPQKCLVDPPYSESPNLPNSKTA
ncbi:MAG: hypothetical protein NHB32_24990 [Fischerella sp. CENA71]|nr:hypothetical protein [Fischerella sp. CENA71]